MSLRCLRGGGAAIARTHYSLGSVSKVFARAIFNLLNEEIRPKLMESQAGFRRGRSLTDHVFVMRQMMEAAKEYDKPLYTAFIDIAKAYDGIPRQALLAVLRRYGVSDRLCQLITMLYRRTSAKVRVGSEESDAFDIESGVKQGCILSTLLFNLYMDFVMRQVIPKLQGKGIEWHVSSKLDPNVRREKGVAHEDVPDGWSSLLMNHLLYADDTTLVAATYEDLINMVTILDNEFEVWGLKVSIQKTEIAIYNALERRRPKFYLRGQHIKEIPSKKSKTFKFLGSLLDFKDGSSIPDMMRRIGMAQNVVKRLKRSVWR